MFRAYPRQKDPQDNSTTVRGRPWREGLSASFARRRDLRCAHNRKPQNRKPRRASEIGSVLACLLVLTGCESIKPATSTVIDRITPPYSAAKNLHNDVLVLDTHIDIPFTFATSEEDPANRPYAQVDLNRLEKGGVDAAFYIVFVPQTARTPENYETAYNQALTKFAGIRRMTQDLYPDRSELALSAEQVRALHKTGRVAVLIGIENGFAMGKDISRLQEFYDLGARYMSLTHNGHNDLGDSAIVRLDLNDRPSEHNGLSSLGRRTVREMNRLGMMIDVAHAGPETVLDIARLTKAPIISSHHAIRSLVDIPRNLSDAELKAVAKTGGVVQIVAFDPYVRSMDPKRAAARTELAKKFGITKPQDFAALSTAERRALMAARRDLDNRFDRGTLSDFVDHIEYAVNLIGIDHVGIASDFDGGGGVVGWDHAKQTPRVTKELLRRGYTEDQIAKLWGANLLRVLSEVEAVAGK